MNVIQWTNRTHSEKQSRACIEMDLKWRISVTSTQQTQLLMRNVSLKVTCDKGTNISNNDLDWQYSQISLNRHLYIDGHLS